MSANIGSGAHAGPVETSVRLMEQVRHIFWDWNGTLFDDAWLCHRVMNDMLRARDMDLLSHERYMELFDFPVEIYYQRIGFDFQKEPFSALGAEFIHLYECRRHEPNLHEDTAEALHTANQRGYSQSILSAYRQETLEELVAHHQLTNWFDALHGHHDLYAAGKIPQAKQALQELQVTPNHAVLIGDTVHDYEVACEIGIHCILIPGGNHSEERLRGCNCPLASSRTHALQLLPLAP